MSNSEKLTQQQAHALFDILVHHEVYSEIARFKEPDAIQNYGPPFSIDSNTPSTSPILQSLLQRFVLPLPGLRDVNKDFWATKAKPFVQKLAEAELSESYDKGRIGSRRVLATASAVLIEYPARGCLGGLPKKERRDEPQEKEEYDLQDEDDIIRAWDDLNQSIIYGDMIDKIFEQIKKTDKLEEHDDVVRGAHEYILLNLATFMHFIMVHSPDGPYLARMMENIHKLVPYMMMRQTLKVGNAATMINGMVRLLLTKLSVGAVTNWLGLSKSAHDGMNLLQQIISTVIAWDITELQRQSLKIEKSKDAPGKDYLGSIREYLKKTRKYHDEARSTSEKEGKSLVAVIFDKASLPVQNLSEAQHHAAVEFLSVNLSIRDRDNLSKVLCYQQPDIVTQGIKDLIAAYDPIIRDMHNAVDLSTGLWDLECFMTDFVKLSKPPGSEKGRRSADGRGSGASTPVMAPPSVEDYVTLLRKHTPSAHRFLHQIAKNGPEVTDQYKQYVQRAAINFRAKNYVAKDGQSGAGMMTPQFDKLVADLPQEKRKTVLDQLDAHSAYLMALQCSSRDRMRSVLSNVNSTDRPSSAGSGAFRGTAKSTNYGPGLYLSRWQQLLDETTVTPNQAKGAVRTGKDQSVRDAEAVDVDGVKKAMGSVGMDDINIKSPDVNDVIELLAPKFADILAQASKKSIHQGQAKV